MTGSEALPYLLLHPLGGDRTFWQPVQAELAPGRAVALDLPGHGSAAPLRRGAGVAEFAAQVADQLAGGPAPVHVVGVSLGGIVAQRLAMDRPDLVASLFLVDTVAVYPEPMRQMWRERADTARRGELASLVPPMVEMWFTPALVAADDARVRRAREVFAGTDAEGYARACDLLATVDLTGGLAGSPVPTVVVCGEDDAPPFRAAATGLADATGGAPVYWLPGRHACAVEAAQAFASLLTAAAPG
ncbi:alpha/beta fold hydrolase [Mycobacterium sp. NPDC003449]